MLHLPVRTPSVKMRLECPAGHDKRPNQNDPSSKHGQSKAAAFQMVLPVESLPDPLQALHSVLKAVEESIHILGGVVAAEGHADGRVDGKRVFAHSRQRMAGLAAAAALAEETYTCASASHASMVSLLMHISLKFSTSGTAFSGLLSSTSGKAFSRPADAGSGPS